MDTGVVVALSIFGVMVLIAVIAAVVTVVSTVSGVAARDVEGQDE